MPKRNKPARSAKVSKAANVVRLAKKAKREAALASAVEIPVTPPDPLTLEANDIYWMSKLAAKAAVDCLNTNDAGQAVELLHIAARYAQRAAELSTELKIEPPAESERLPPEIRFAQELGQSALMLVRQQPLDAGRIAERALNLFEANGGDEFQKVHLALLNIVGTVFWSAQQFERGLAFLQRAESLCDAIGDDGLQLILLVLHKIVATAKSLNKVEEVARALRRVKVIGITESDELSTVPQKIMAAQMLQEEEWFEDALSGFHKVLKIIDATLEADKEQVDIQAIIVTLSGLTELLNHFARAAEAAPYVERLFEYANQGAISVALLKLDYLVFDQENRMIVKLKNPDGSERPDIPASFRKSPSGTVLPVAKDFDLNQYQVPVGAVKN